MTRDDLEALRGIGNVVGERTHLVETARKGDQAVAADQPVGRLDPHDPAQRRRLADGTTGVGAEGEGGESCRHRRSTSSTGAARHPRRVMRVARRTEGRVLRRRSHGELVEVGLSDHHRTRTDHALDNRGGVGRSPPLEDPRRARGRHPPRAEVVLDGDGNPRQRTGVDAGGHLGVDGVGGRPGILGQHRHKGMDLPFAGRDGRQVRLEHLSGTALARSNAGGNRRGRLGDRVEAGHQGSSPSTGGTRKRSSSTSGAHASTSARSRLGRTRSSRNTLRNGRG